MSLLGGDTPTYLTYGPGGQPTAPAPARGFLGRLFGWNNGPAYLSAPVATGTGVGLQKQLTRPRAESTRPAAAPAVARGDETRP